MFSYEFRKSFIQQEEFLLFRIKMISAIHTLTLALILETFIALTCGQMTVKDTLTIKTKEDAWKIEDNIKDSVTSTGSFVEKAWTTTAAIESPKKGIQIGWKKGVNPLTASLDCCFGDDMLDCIGSCILGDKSCALNCGYLIFPQKPTTGQDYSTSLSSDIEGLVWLRVAITDLSNADKISIFYEKGGQKVAEITCGSFTNDELEKFFTSEKYQLFVTYEALSVVNEEGCSQLEPPTKKLYFRTVSKVQCPNVEIDMNDADTQGKLFSPPDSPYPPLRDCSWTIKASSDGYGIGLFIDALDLNGFYGDHLRISAGGPHTFLKKGYIFTWNTNPLQQYLKVFPGGLVTLYFHSGRHLAPTTHKGFEVEYRQFGNGSIPDSTTSSTTLVTPSAGYNANASLYFAGKTPIEVYEEQSIIKASLVYMANTYCSAENISLEEQISLEDIYFHRITHCPSPWPYSSTCAEVVVQIIAKTVTGKYELTDYNILKMWERYGYDGNMTATGVMPYHQNPHVVTWWFWLAGLTLGLFALLIFSAWCKHKYNERADYVRQVNQSKVEVDQADNIGKNLKNAKKKEKKGPIIIVTEEDKFDYIAYDRRESFYDYDIPEYPEVPSYYDYNNEYGLTTLGEKINHAFIPDEEEELDPVDLGRDDFRFEFIAPSERVIQNYDLPIHEQVISLDGNSDHDLAETNL